MKSLILYSMTTPPKKLPHDYMPLRISPVGKDIWIRYQVVRGDMDFALLRAKPRRGETVLNSIELEAQ